MLVRLRIRSIVPITSTVNKIICNVTPMYVMRLRLSQKGLVMKVAKMVAEV